VWLFENIYMAASESALYLLKDKVFVSWRGVCFFMIAMQEKTYVRARTDGAELWTPGLHHLVSSLTPRSETLISWTLHNAVPRVPRRNPPGN
jgi:hypothetical protein